MKIIAFVFASVAAIKVREEPSFKVEVKSFAENGHVSSCKDGDTAKVNYTGRLTDGKVFDSSIKDGIADPFKFTIGASQVIKCWDMAVFQMQPGEKATVTCPPNLAYGEEGAGDTIGPNATLIFDIDVLDCETGF